MPVEIVVEAGINHGGDVDKAKKLAEVALSVGANIVKFQTYEPDKLLRRHSPEFDLLAAHALKRHEFKELARHCERIGIEFMTTPGDRDSLRFAVEELGVKRIKIGSDDLTNYSLLFEARKTQLPLILSTGMATMVEVYDALCAVSKYQVTFLHCVSLYPCPLKDANIAAIPAMREALKEWDVPIGYSDHTRNASVCVAAVGAGATMIEAHMRLMRGEPPIDAAVSYLPAEFVGLVDRIRDAEEAMGHGLKEPGEAEQKMIPVLRKGVDGLRGQP